MTNPDGSDAIKEVKASVIADNEIMLNVTRSDFVVKGSYTWTIKSSNGTILGTKNEADGLDGSVDIVNTGVKLNDKSDRVTVEIDTVDVTEVKATGAVTATLAEGLSNASVDFDSSATSLTSTAKEATFKVTTTDLFGSGKEYENGKIKVTFAVENGTSSQTTGVVESTALSSDAEQSISLGNITANLKGAVKVTVTKVELVKAAP